MKFIALLTVFLAIQVAVGVLCLSRLRVVVFGDSRRGALTSLITVEAAAVVALLLGAYMEARWEAFSNPSDLSRKVGRTESPEIVRANNPALLETLDSQRPFLERPGTLRPADLKQWQTDLRTTLTDDVFGLSEISTVEVVPTAVHSTTRLKSGVIRESIAITAQDGVQIPAYLFLPDDSAKRAAIIVIPGHVGESESGIEQTGVLYDSYQHAAALRLAEAGFATLTLELRGFGQLGEVYGTEHRLVAYNAILAGTFYKAIIARDLKNAVDFLQTRAEIDPDRIGITGASYGGEMSVAYAALDPRIKVIVFQAYGGAADNNPGVTGSKDDQPHYCHIIPGANLLFHREDMFLLLAPRPTLGIRGHEEPFYNRRFNKILQDGWSTLGRRGDLELRTERGGHEYFVGPAIDFFRKHL